MPKNPHAVALGRWTYKGYKIHISSHSSGAYLVRINDKPLRDPSYRCSYRINDPVRAISQYLGADDADWEKFACKE